MSTPVPPDALPPDFDTRLPEDIEVRRCYRHPDRETGVSCINCGRAICYDCMIPAAVGFQCPACVKEQGGKAPRAKVVTRGEIRSRWTAGPGGSGGITVTKVLIALNLLMFVVELLVGATTLMGGGSSQALVDIGALYVPYVLVRHEYWRLVSSMFLHSGLIHIAFNMYALWAIGGFVEAAVGRVKFTALYFLSGLAGSVLVLVAASPNALVVGASGAIFGVFGALAVHAFLNRGRDFQSRALLNNVLLILAINLVLSFTMGVVSWQAHVGGLVAGATTMYLFMWGGKKDPRAPFALSDALAIAAVALVLVVITWWRVATFIA